MSTRRATVTGAFSNIGAAAAAQLAGRGWSIATLTNRTPPPESPYQSEPLRFDPDHLRAALTGSELVVNTYWVRTPSHGAPFDEAIANSRMLVAAARDAGVQRFVQLSVTHATPDSPSPYYAGKALVDDYVRQEFTAGAIVQPTLVVGPRDVLTGNMAWFMRRTPVVPVPRGEHPLQPVTLGDVASVIADQAEASGMTTIEAAGPERYAFRDYMRVVAEALGVQRRFVSVPRGVFLAMTAVAGAFMRDDIVTRDELDSLRRGSLVPAGLSPCTSSVANWLAEHGRDLGRSYVNDRRRRRASSARARRSG